MEVGFASRAAAPPRVRFSAPRLSRERIHGMQMERRNSSFVRCIHAEEVSEDSSPSISSEPNETGDKLGVRIRRASLAGSKIHSAGEAFFKIDTEENTPRNILEEMVWNKDVEILNLKEDIPLILLLKVLSGAPPARDFIGTLKEYYNRTGVPALIAEVKKASPSKGVLRENFDPVSIAKSYEENGAACLSVLTDQKYFQGSFENIVAIRKADVKLPILCKEFVIDAYQLFYARSKGADAVLLIAAILPGLDLQYMLKVCKKLGLTALVEVHDEREMDLVLALEGVELIGINNRNLETFEVDISNTKRLLEGERGRIITEKNILVVGESGFFTPEDISFAQNAGAKAVLVGEALIKQEDPGKAISGLFGKDLSAKV